MNKSWLPYLPIAVLVLTLPLMIYGSMGAMSTFENDLARWPVGTTIFRQQFDDFQSRFESTDVLIVSWPDCTVDNPNLRQVISGLDSELGQYIEQISDGQSTLETLTDDLSLTEKAAQKRLAGTFIGPNKNQTCLYISLNRTGTKDRYSVMDAITSVLTDNDVNEDEIRFAGPAYNMHNIDIEGFWSPLRAVPLISFLSFLLTWYFTRRFALALFVNVISSYTAGFALSSVYVTGVNLNTLVWTMPSLILLLTTSAALHFLSYYRRARERNSFESAPFKAAAIAWRPIMYCSVTTAVGLFSLMLSNMVPVKQFGFYGGISVLASSIVVLSCFPAWLSWFPYEAGKSAESKVWPALANFTSRFRWPIIVSILLVASFLLIAITKLKTSAQISNFFPASSNVIKDANWFEENVCSISTIEMVLTFEGANEENDVNRMRMLDFLHKKFLAYPNINGVLSAATYAPANQQSRRQSIGNVLAKQSARKKIEQAKLELVRTGMISLDNESDAESWRVSLRVDESGGQIEPDFVDELESIVHGTFSKTSDSHFSGESLNLFSTGTAILFDFVEKQFLRDLVLTYATAFGLISIVILLIMRSFVCVAIATPPNLFPAAFVLGGVGMSGLFLDVGSLMTASVALGIAVDDTLHFFLWWREKVRAGMPTKEAIVDAMNHCGLAMFQTTMVCGISIALYSYCGFLPTVRFGLLLSAMMFAALIGDLLLLPALLSTRLWVWARGKT